MNNSVCLFTNEFPYGLQETFIENEVASLCENFDRVVIVPLFKNTTIREFPYKNLHVMTPVNSSRDVTIHKFVLIFHPVFWITLFHGFRDIGFSPKKIIKVIKQAFIVARLKKYILKRPEVSGVDLWYFYWGTNAISVLPFLEDHPKAVTRFHGYDLYSDDVRSGEVQVFQRQVLEKVNKAFFVSNDGRKYLEDKFGDLKDKLEISRLGVPDRGTSKQSDDKVLRIVTCSNIYKVKRLDLFAKAISKIKDIPVHWTHFGDGPQPLKLTLFKEVSKFTNNINFTFMGRRKNSDVMKFYAENAVDLFVNTSESEGLPVSIMEALSFGIPVMATNVGGTSELVNSEVGWILDKNISATALAREIEKFYHEKFGSEKERIFAKELWQKFANSDFNYLDFVRQLKEV
jgi:colanic acid/amylovoran biosynthesis glycosyltransferase